MINKDNTLDHILKKYSESFSAKVYSEENQDTDILMDIFRITPSMKRENRQYWGRELGKCWESLVIETCKDHPLFQPALRMNSDEPCDLRLGQYAIDTKYRMGSGDSGTLKKFKQYGPLLREQGYTPILLFLREDNLPAAINACSLGGWEILVGKDSFCFIKSLTGFDLEDYLKHRADKFPVIR